MSIDVIMFCLQIKMNSHTILCLECYTPTSFGIFENDGSCYRTEYLMKGCKTETPEDKTMQNLQNLHQSKV